MKYTSLLLFCCASLIAGCATAPISYHYGNYSKTLYRTKKDNTPESILKHKNELEDIIKVSNKKGIRVPPGIYCEYAYMLSKQGNADANKYFTLEVATYPESMKFVQFIQQQVQQTPTNTK